MNPAIRPVEPEEMGAFVRACEAAFGEGATDTFTETFTRLHPADRTVAAFDREDIVGTAGSYPFSLSVPGGEIAAAGVTVVGVKPTHRRRGLLRAMMRRQLDDLHARGEPLAVLWASEEPIYQRFGYGPGSSVVRASIERDRARFLDDSAPVGRGRLVEEDEAVKVLPQVYETVRRAVPGLFYRSEEWWRLHTMADTPEERDGAGPLFRMVWENEDGPGAYVLYRVKDEWDLTSKSVLRVREAVAATPEAEREMWRFIFGVDLIDRIEVAIPSDSPLPLMVREHRRLGLRHSDALWTRVVDLPAALEARAYPVVDDVRLRVVDEFCPWNDGTWRIETTSGRARVERHRGEADLVMTARELGAVYLGGVRATDLWRAGRIIECTPGALRRADALFGWDRAPFCSEIF